MAGREDSAVVLGDAGVGQALLLYCGGQEQAASTAREDMMWVVGGDGGGEEGVLLPDELGGETLLLLGDHLSLLPTSPDLTPPLQISAEEIPNNNSSKITATYAHTSTTHTQQTHTQTKLTYTDAHTKPPATFRTHTNMHSSPVVTTTTITSPTVPKAYTSAHRESTLLKTYTNTKKSTYTNILETNTHTQVHTQRHPLTQTHIQIKPQTHTQTKPQPPQTHVHTRTHTLQVSEVSALRAKLVSGCKSSLDEDELSEEPFVGPSLRWAAQTPKSYRGAKLRDTPLPPRKNGRKVPQRADTDGETSGMGSSVDEPVESSTESASEAPSTPPAFIQPRPSASRGPSSTSPTAIKKRRGGWPKGRKRKPELPGAKPPKAPLTAYVLFLNERRKYYRETRPELSFGAVTKVLGAEWSAMSVEQKAAFVSRSEQDKRRYRNELQAYRQSHDYQLLLRKKRIKNVIRRGGTTTEESSDFTDEIDDDDSEELYCRICDQLFTSLHNKREHLYGKTHLQAITGEYQRERLAEEERQMAAALRVGQGAGDCLTCGSPLTPHTPHLAPARKGVDSLLVGCPSCSPSPAPPQSPRTPQEDDHDGDKEDEEEEEDGQDEGGISSTPPSPPPPPTESITEALEGVMAKVMEREEEIHALRQSSVVAVAAKEELNATLSRLQARGRRLGATREALDRRNAELKATAETLWRLPALFGVTPLQMVEVTTRITQEQQQQDDAEVHGQEEEEDEEEEEEDDDLCQQEEELGSQDEGIHLQQQDLEENTSGSDPELVECLLKPCQDSTLLGGDLLADGDGQQHQQQVQNKTLMANRFLSQSDNFHQHQHHLPRAKVQYIQVHPQQQQQQQKPEQLIYIEDLELNHHYQHQQQEEEDEDEEEVAIEIQDEEVLQHQLIIQQEQQQVEKEKEEEEEEVVISEEELHLLGQQLQPLQLGGQQQQQQNQHEPLPLLKNHPPQQQLVINNPQIQLLQQPQQLLILHENGNLQPQLPPQPQPQRQRRQILLLEREVGGMYLKKGEEEVMKEGEKEDRKANTMKPLPPPPPQQLKRHLLHHSTQPNTATQPHTYKPKVMNLIPQQGHEGKGQHKKTKGIAKHPPTQSPQNKQLQTLKQRDVKRKTRALKTVPLKQDKFEQQPQEQEQPIPQNIQHFQAYGSPQQQEQLASQHFQVYSNPQQQRGRQTTQRRVTFAQQTAESTAGERQRTQKASPLTRATGEPDRSLPQHQESLLSVQLEHETQVPSFISEDEAFEASFDPSAFQGRLELELPEDLGLQDEEDLLQQDLFNLQQEEDEIGTRDLILLDNT